MTVSRKELIEALEFIMPGVATGGRIEGSQFATFYHGGVYSYNDAITARAEFPMEAGFQCAVSAQELLTIMKRIEVAECNIKLDDTKLIIKAGKSKATLGTAPVNKNSPIYLETPTWVELPSDFYDAFSACHIPGNRHPLAGTCLEGSNAIATDGRRITHVGLSTDTERIWLNDAAIKTILKYGNTFEQYGLTTAYVWFTGPRGTLCVKRLNEEQYRMEAVMGYYNLCKKSEVETVDIPDGLQAAILRAAPFTETIQTIHPVQLSVGPGGIYIEVKQGKDAYEETIDFEEELPITDFTVQVDYSHLLQALKWAKEMGVCRVGNVTMLCLYGGANTTLLTSLRG